MKRIFVRYVSHEIRTPLSVALLGLQCLEQECASFVPGSTCAVTNTHASTDGATKTASMNRSTDVGTLSSIAEVARANTDTATVESGHVELTTRPMRTLQEEIDAVQRPAAALLRDLDRFLDGNNDDNNNHHPSGTDRSTGSDTTVVHATNKKNNDESDAVLSAAHHNASTSAAITTSASATTHNPTNPSASVASSSLFDVLDEVKVSCTLAVEILNDLLLYEKIDDGVFVLARERVCLWPMLREAEKLFHLQARAAEVHLHLRYHDDASDKDNVRAGMTLFPLDLLL